MFVIVFAPCRRQRALCGASSRRRGAGRRRSGLRGGQEPDVEGGAGAERSAGGASPPCARTSPPRPPRTWCARAASRCRRCARAPARPRPCACSALGALELFPAGAAFAVPVLGPGGRAVSAALDDASHGSRPRRRRPSRRRRRTRRRRPPLPLALDLALLVGLVGPARRRQGETGEEPRSPETGLVVSTVPSRARVDGAADAFRLGGGGRLWSSVVMAVGMPDPSLPGLRSCSWASRSSTNLWAWPGPLLMIL